MVSNSLDTCGIFLLECEHIACDEVALHPHHYMTHLCFKQRRATLDNASDIASLFSECSSNCTSDDDEVRERILTATEEKGDVEAGS